MKKYGHNDISKLYRNELGRAFDSVIYEFADAFSGIEVEEEKLLAWIRSDLKLFLEGQDFSGKVQRGL
jgi:hypothetical protein